MLLLLYNRERQDSPTKNSISLLSTVAGRLEAALRDEYLDPMLIDPDKRRAVTISKEVDHEHHSLMIAQVDVGTHPLVAYRLGVHPEVELPAIRILRGDATYGYKIRAPAGEFVTRTGKAVLDELNTPVNLLTTRPSLLPSPAAAKGVSRGEQPTSLPPFLVVATLHTLESVCALQLVAHTFRKPDESSGWPGVAFALSSESTVDAAACPHAALTARSSEALHAPSSVAPSASPPSLPPHAPPSRPAGHAADLSVEKVVLYSSETPISTPFEMPLSLVQAQAKGFSAGLEAKTLHSWVHWAALPKWASLDDDLPVMANSATVAGGSTRGGAASKGTLRSMKPIAASGCFLREGEAARLRVHAATARRKISSEQQTTPSKQREEGETQHSQQQLFAGRRWCIATACIAVTMSSFQEVDAEAIQRFVAICAVVCRLSEKLRFRNAAARKANDEEG